MITSTMPAKMAPGQLLLSIHDVTPALEDGVHRLWNWCRAVEITPALFVVPNWHGAWPIEQHAPFVRWLLDAQAAGADILLHGERHDEVGSPRTWRDEWRALGRTANEGEFLTLSPEIAEERIVRGLDRLIALGLDPIGFVPPAWLAPASTHAVVQELTKQYPRVRCSEDVVGIHHAAGVQAAPVIRWSGRTDMRARLSQMVAGWHRRWLRNAPLVRIGVHPQDLDHPITAASVHESLRHWTRARTAITYRSLCT
ncbi:MAG TPA: polysaccharide deacetylase family protein [Gemmatimonas sp.]|uniref:polysaccharide deacetylase family protein n=1 Tax=Gemmatimonas sp. TaxID=1962908 RepID=UPI002EDB7308